MSFTAVTVVDAQQLHSLLKDQRCFPDGVRGIISSVYVVIVEHLKSVSLTVWPDFPVITSAVIVTTQRHCDARQVPEPILPAQVSLFTRQQNPPQVDCLVTLFNNQLF